MSTLPYLRGYPPAIIESARRMVDAGKLGAYLAERYPDQHAVQTDKALYHYVCDLKHTHLRSAPAIDKVVYDSKLQVIQHALGLHTAISRVQGNKLKAKKEIRVAALFKAAAPEFLQMIVVHELAHLKSRDHDKAFYQLCCHMLPNYLQLELDLRLYLTYLATHPHKETPHAIP